MPCGNVSVSRASLSLRVRTSCCERPLEAVASSGGRRTWSVNSWREPRRLKAPRRRGGFAPSCFYASPQAFLFVLASVVDLLDFTNEDARSPHVARRSPHNHAPTAHAKPTETMAAANNGGVIVVNVRLLPEESPAVPAGQARRGDGPHAAPHVQARTPSPRSRR